MIIIVIMFTTLIIMMIIGTIGMIVILLVFAMQNKNEIHGMEWATLLSDKPHDKILAPMSPQICNVDTFDP